MRKIYLLLTLLVTSVFADNSLPSFKPGQVWSDNNGIHINAHGGGVLLYKGMYYWFGEHKIEGRTGNNAQVGVHVYSSKDLYNWKDEGIALAVSSNPNSDIAKGCILERPKVIFNAKTKKFVMWFHLELKGRGYSTARSGIAVADKVTGPYTFVRSIRPNAGHWPQNVTAAAKDTNSIERTKAEKDKFGGGPTTKHKQFNILGSHMEGGQMARDMTLFVDDDGKAYHLYSSEHNSTLHISLLTDDYLDHAGSYVRVFPFRWMEAPAICKHKGRYYLIASGCTGWKANAARSAVADNIFGPWEELGNPCIGERSGNGLGPSQTFGGQSTYILPVAGKDDAFIVMFDIWRPKNAIDGRYVWLPMQFTANGFKIKWLDQWDFSFFDKNSKHHSEQKKASTGYIGDRMRDAGDVFTATVGMGAGAKARVGPVQAGALYNIDMWGLRGGDFGDVPWYEICTRDALFPIPASWAGYPPMESGRFGDERFACGCKRHRSWQRGKSFAAKAPLPFLGAARQPEYYTQIEVAVGVLGSIRLGFNPGELLDFLLGWTTLDIYGDDLETPEKIEQGK